MVNMADLSSDEVRQVHKDTGSGEKRRTGEAFTVDFGDMKSKEGKKNLQESFIKFKKQRQKELRDEKRLRERCLRKQGDVEHMNKLRKKFVKRAKKYFGTPYAKKYWSPDQPEYKSRLFLDCCGLVRQVMRDLRKDFGFRLGPWNQAYMFDLLPNVVEREEDMKPGDLVFISGTYPRPNARQQKHLMTHVEIWAGDRNKTIGARWNNGKVQVWDDYRFEAKSFIDAKYHFRSLDTWLQGICRSFCPEHKWRRTFSPSKKSIFSIDGEKSKSNDQKLENNPKSQLPQDVPMTASRQGKEDDIEEELEEDMEEEDEDAEPACDSDEEGLDPSPRDPDFLMSPRNVCGKVKYNGACNRFPNRPTHSSANNTLLNESEDDSEEEEEEEEEELSVGGKIASLNISDASMTRPRRLQRSQTDLLPGRNKPDYESQRLLSHSVQELPTRFPVIVNDVGKAKLSYRNGHERIKHLSERCLASPRNAQPAKQETMFKTKRKSMEERRKIFKGLEQSKSVLLINNDISDEDSDDVGEETDKFKSISDEGHANYHASDELVNFSPDDLAKLPPDDFVKPLSNELVKQPLNKNTSPSPNELVDVTREENDIIEKPNEDNITKEDDVCPEVCNGLEYDDSKDNSEEDEDFIDIVQTVTSPQSQDEENVDDEENSSQGDHVVTN
ncbi:uncharacterized protein LOC117345280 [Pecten maximus]|uniref:uncharacterized protein LOC117345280 n=1 Tax=Pecten maximus TaxID=6579 RepID=UPI001457F3F4|nr:uncharacterized protein LOC117345280 [Pecten maximus]